MIGEGALRTFVCVRTKKGYAVLGNDAFYLTLVESIQRMEREHGDTKKT